MTAILSRSQWINASAVKLFEMSLSWHPVTDLYSPVSFLITIDPAFMNCKSFDIGTTTHHNARNGDFFIYLSNRVVELITRTPWAKSLIHSINRTLLLHNNLFFFKYCCGILLQDIWGKFRNVNNRICIVSNNFALKSNNKISYWHKGAI